MSDYRRWYVTGGTVFFTVVTYHRKPLFANVQACNLLGQVMRGVRADLPFETVAAVLLPDHLHTIWTLPADVIDFSTRWKRIKRDFTVRWLRDGGSEATVTNAQAHRGNRGVWQKRFYEHQVRDEDELSLLCDYIHFNPVKHEVVNSVREWKYSTFHRFVAAGHYSTDWGRGQIVDIDGLE
jgi:REP-associated tyrosine transposase